MAEGRIKNTELAAIAAAIRSQNGESTVYKPAEMAQAILDIPTGGSSVIESKSITENGTYTAPTGVDGYSPVTVAVQPNLQSKTATENGTVTPDSGYDGLSSVVVDVSGGSSTPLYSLNESQGGVWVNTNVDVTNFSAFSFKRYNGNECVGVASLLKSQIAVYTGGSDVYTTVFGTTPAFNVRIYNNLLYVSFNGTGVGTKYVDVYDLEV